MEIITRITLNTYHALQLQYSASHLRQLTKKRDMRRLGQHLGFILEHSLFYNTISDTSIFTSRYSTITCSPMLPWTMPLNYWSNYLHTTHHLTNTQVAPPPPENHQVSWPLTLWRLILENQVSLPHNIRLRCKSTLGPGSSSTAVLCSLGQTVSRDITGR